MPRLPLKSWNYSGTQNKEFEADMEINHKKRPKLQIQGFGTARQYRRFMVAPLIKKLREWRAQ
jgi:hypothetical protein